MKVSEAKEKMCPFVSIPSDIIMPNQVYPNMKCICGDCMAWKWTYTREVLQSEYEGYCARIGQ